MSVNGKACPWTLEALLVLCVQLSLCSLSGGSGRTVSWAVKLTMTSPEDIERRAVELARERGLEFVGRVDPFSSIFEFRLSQDAQYQIEERGIGKKDAQSVEDTFHDELSGHPAVKWVSKQVALKRTKREFSDPAFVRQWHLVHYHWTVVLQLLINSFSSG